MAAVSGSRSLSLSGSPSRTRARARSLWCLAQLQLCQIVFAMALRLPWQWSPSFHRAVTVGSAPRHLYGAGLRAIHSTAPSFSRKATRKALTGKMGNKNYLKGKGSRPIGRHTKHGNYVVDAPVYPHATRSHERCLDLRGRLRTHPAYSGTEERLPTLDQQAFELSRLIIKSYRRFLGLPNLGALAPAQTGPPPAPMPAGASELACLLR